MLNRVDFERNWAAIALGELECVKTGCDVFIEPYDQWGHGDAFMAGSMLVLRLAGVSDRPMSNRRHFTVLNADQWFDRKETSMDRNSTLIVAARSFIPHGYDGADEPAISPADETVEEA
jgi:hypothetical protein